MDDPRAYLFQTAMNAFRTGTHSLVIVSLEPVR
jgi:hypothetical protein